MGENATPQYAKRDKQGSPLEDKDFQDVYSEGESDDGKVSPEQRERGKRLERGAESLGWAAGGCTRAESEKHGIYAAAEPKRNIETDTRTDGWGKSGGSIKRTRRVARG